MSRLAGNVLQDGRHAFGGFRAAQEVVEQTRAVRLGEEDGALVFLQLCGHLHGVVGQLVRARLVGVDAVGIGARPLLSVYDRPQDPWGVGLVVDGEITHFLAAHGG